MVAEDTSARKASKSASKPKADKLAGKPVTPDNGPWLSKEGTRHANRIRPSIYDDGMLKRVCDGLVQGLSIKQTCEPMDMPRWQEVYLEMQRSEEVRTAIAGAREAQQEVTADDIVEMADLATAEDHNVVKLRIWARQWRAAKLAPKKYGEKQTVDINVDMGKTAAAVLMDLSNRANQIEHQVIDITPVDPSLDKGGDIESNQQDMAMLPKDSGKKAR